MCLRPVSVSVAMFASLGGLVATGGLALAAALVALARLTLTRDLFFFEREQMAARRESRDGEPIGRWRCVGGGLVAGELVEVTLVDVEHDLAPVARGGLEHLLRHDDVVPDQAAGGDDELGDLFAIRIPDRLLHVPGLVAVLGPDLLSEIDAHGGPPLFGDRRLSRIASASPRLQC